MTPLKKMTIKTCGDFSVMKIRAALLALGPQVVQPDGTTKQQAPEDGTALDIIKIAGEASGAESGQTDKGSYTKLTGQFIGTDLTTGELYSSRTCILPDYIGAELGAALLGAGEGGQSVNFAFLITAKQKASAVTGYEFGIKSLMNIEPTNAAKRLMELAGIQAPAPKLAAPAAPAPAAEAPAPAAAPAAAPAPAAKSAKK